MFQSQLYWDRETKKYIISINITSNWVNQAIQNIVSSSHSDNEDENNMPSFKP